ncbi:MAG: TlpA disulfide reductase family protein [Acidobacteriota bacterium]
MARRFGVLVAMLAVLALLVVAGAHNLAKRRAAMQAAAAQHVTLQPAEAAGSSDGSDSLGKDMVGKVVPEFTLATPEGKKVSLADYKGKTVIVNFWATYCGPCREEMPWFQEFSQKYAGRNLVVLGLDQEDGVTKEQVAKAASKIGVTYPILIANDKVAGAFGLGDYLPVTYYVSSQGKIIVQTPGAPTKDEMESYIQKALAAGGA